MVQGFKNFRGCPKATHQFKVFQNGADWYAVIATNAVQNNTEIYTFTAVRTFEFFLNFFCFCSNSLYLLKLNGCGRLLETLPTRQAFDFEVVRTNDIIRLVVLEKTPTKYPHKRAGSSVYTVNLATDATISVTRREVLPSEKPTCITTWLFVLFIFNCQIDLIIFFLSCTGSSMEFHMLLFVMARVVTLEELRAIGRSLIFTVIAGTTSIGAAKSKHIFLRRLDTSAYFPSII